MGPLYLVSYDAAIIGVIISYDNWEILLPPPAKVVVLLLSLVRLMVAEVVAELSSAVQLGHVVNFWE